jgi:hypothetical protein
MSNEPHVTTEFRRYLLGELPEPARTAFEEAYFSDPDLMEEIWAAETDLVDAYVTDRLDGEERRLFESQYLTSPHRRERVAVARALQSRIQAAGFATADDEDDAPATAPPEPTAATPFRPRVVTGAVDSGGASSSAGVPARTAPAGTVSSRAAVNERLKPAARPPRFTTWQLAAAAAIVLAAATLAWLLMRPGGPMALPPPSSSASSTPAPPATAPEQTPKPAPPETVPPGARPEGATPNTAPPGTVAANPPSTSSPLPPPPGGTRAPMTVLAVTLSPIQLRSDAGQTNVTVPSNTDRITLRFEGDRGAAREVAVDVRTVEGRRVWTGGLRLERPTPPGIAAVVAVPAKALPPDDYIATLFAIDANGERTELNRYVFRIGRK